MDSGLEALNQGVLAAADLRNRLRISPATLMRLIHQAGPSVVRIGRGRASRYGRVEHWQGSSASQFPIFAITEAEKAESAGQLITLAARQTVKMPEGVVVHGLPVNVIDARPSGFLGRHFAAHHADLGLPRRLTDWSMHHILVALTRRGEDLTGNLIIGEESFSRWQALRMEATTPDAYPELATQTLAGHPPGSSAGGERPKFGAFVDGRHVLVKFSLRGASNDLVSRRWCDLLVLEALALEVVTSCGISAAATRLWVTDTHYFLESSRFDRVGPRGRVAVLSLAAAHDDPSDSWARAAVHLRNVERLSEEDARRLQWLDAYGALIANTDRHPYNIVFFPDGEWLRLAPAFDQVSMLYAPTPEGQLLPRTFTLPHSSADTLDVWDSALAAAKEFWRRAADDVRLSDEVRRISTQNVKIL